MVKGINLVPDDVKRGWYVRRVRRALTAGLAAYAALLVFVFAGQISEIRSKNAEADVIDAQKTALAAQSSGYSELEAKLAGIRRAEGEVRKRLEVTGSLVKGRVLWSFILKRLSAGVPDGVWLRGLSTTDVQGGKKMRILGSSLTGRGVTEFVFMLENSGLFTDVTLSYAQKKEVNSVATYDFEAYASIRPQGVYPPSGEGT